jgi:hypothetical protein
MSTPYRSKVTLHFLRHQAWLCAPRSTQSCLYPNGKHLIHTSYGPSRTIATEALLHLRVASPHCILSSTRGLLQESSSSLVTFSGTQENVAKAVLMPATLHFNAGVINETVCDALSYYDLMSLGNLSASRKRLILD